MLAVLRLEPGREIAAEAMSGASVLAVNLAEIVSRMAESGMPEAELREKLGRLPFDIVDAGEALAWRAGALRSATKSAGLSLGDRFCIALAQHLGAAVFTADRAWAGLDLGVEVVLIR